MIKKITEKFNLDCKKDIVYPFLLYVIFFFIHLVYSIHIDYPLLSPDEHSYIGNVRQFLYGYGFCPYIHYYNPGYSFAIIPAFLFSDKIEVIFKSIQVLNAGFASFIPVLIYALVAKFAQNVQARERFLIAFLISLCPAFIVYPSMALSEALFVPLYLLLALLLYYLIKYNQKLLYIVTPVLGVYLWLIHPRGLGILISLVLVLAVFCVKNKKFLNLGIFSVFLLISILIRHFINAEMDSYLLLTMSQNLEKIDYYSSSNMIAFYSIPSNVLSLYKYILGHLLYVSLSTYGLFLMGAFYLIRTVNDKIKRNEKFYLESFCIFSYILVFMGSAVYMNYYRFTADNFFYGRYQEAVIIPILIFGLIYFLTSKINLKTVLSINLFVLFSAFCLYWSSLNVIEGWPSLDIMISGMYLFKWLTPNYGFVVLVLVYLLLMNLIFLIRAKNKFAALIFMAITLVVHSVVIHFDLLQVNSKMVPESSKLVPVLKELMYKNAVSAISYDKSGANARAFYNYKIFLPEVEYKIFDSRKKEEPCEKIIISGNPKLNKIYSNLEFIGVEKSRGQYLWRLKNK